MSEVFEKYIKEVVEKYSSGQAGEHAYRPPLENLFKEISGLRVVNDPKRSEYGSPDFVFLNKKTTIAYAEAKDIDISLDRTEEGEQMGRYFGYSNLILTNCLEFRFYRNGSKYGQPIRVAELKEGVIIPLKENFKVAEDTIREFVVDAREPIKSGEVLAKVMAGKARRMRDNVRIFLSSGKDGENKDLIEIYKVIKEKLIANLDYEKFADMYAQTVVYGLFVARYYDKTPDDFSRQEARDLIPASNPLLRHFFDHITGPSFDKRIEIIVNELCEEFSNSDVNAIIHNYYNVEKDSSRDPIIHFYEDFLKEYDPRERIKLGVFYTPLPVVRFIVASIDEILRKEFSLEGLADCSKTDISRELEGRKIKQSIHKVQILDPATGTGTFLNEVVSRIKDSFSGQEGRWPKYVKEELLPRLYGFELMVAPYTIAHLKLSTTVKESGAEIGDQRIKVYLTNSLEKGEERGKDLFSFGLGGAITDESSEAGVVKNKLPIMVVLGNPPYSGESMNPGYTENDAYKLEPGTKIKLQERNSKWINDDYVKFIRLAESLIEKTGEGVVGMITAHGYLDNPTFRGMRYHLMQAFDSLHVLDLHGNANKKEVADDGNQDKNVFDIKTGVSIILAIKKKNKSKRPAEVFRFDILGTREKKFDFLNNNSFDTVKWKKVNVVSPNYQFVIRDEKVRGEYEKGFSIAELFVENGVGIVSARDNFVINKNEEKLINNAIKFRDSQAKDQASLCFELSINNKKGWDALRAREMLRSEKEDLDSFIQNIDYRPFDRMKIFYHPSLIWRMVDKIMKNFRNDNLSLVSTRQVKAGKTYQHIFVSKSIVESTYISNKTSEIGYVFPLYLYENGQKIPNFNKEIYKNFISNLKKQIKPEDIIDYIYSYLYSPSYREKYKDFLKADFPKVPCPENDEKFFALVKLGRELRSLHLLESSKVSKPITTYPVSGSDKVDKVEYRENNVYINKEQYFGGIPGEVWEFYIGGYQPAQKWLKDRKGLILSAEDISHYQKIIVSLFETIKVMEEIDSEIKK